MKKLTLLVSVYDSAEWLRTKFDNVRQCNILPYLEVMVLNAASPNPLDDEIISQNQDIISHYEKCPDRIGVYDAWNRMIDKSTAPFITNANTDDIVAPDCYSRQISSLEVLGRDYGFSYVSWYVTKRPSQVWPPKEADPSGKPGMFMGDINKAGVGHFPLWRRSLHSKFGKFDVHFKALGDVDFWTRCYHGGVKFKWITEPLACYMYRAEDPIVARRNLWHQSDNVDEWKRYWSKVERYSAGQLSE